MTSSRPAAGMASDPPASSTPPPATNAAKDVRCDHCNLPVPPGLIDESREHQFCCGGCEAVYAVIHGCGLEQFYRVKATLDEPSRPASTTGRGYDEFDADAFTEHYVTDAGGEHRAVELFLENVHCAACVWLVEKLPAVLVGVIEARLEMRRGLVRITWDPARVSLSRIARTLDSLGYPPHPARDTNARDIRRREDRHFLIRIAVAGALAGNVMLLAISLHAGAVGDLAVYFRWVSMGLGLLALLWPGRLFLQGAWAAIRTRTAHMDLPIALGLFVGTVAGTINTIVNAGEVYFDSLTALVFLLLVGRWIQRRQQRWAADAIELMHAVTPATARLVEGETIREVATDAVQPGNILEARAGDTIPVDGIVTTGRSQLDESLLTGESRPVPAEIDSPVFAGATNLTATIRLRAEATGGATRVGRLMQLVERCAADRAPIVQLADRLAGWFTAAVITLAAGTLGVWLWIDPHAAVGHATALLIVACPCALGLATPLAVATAIGRSAQRGILIKGGQTLESLARPGLMLLDKTGTLTAGKTALVRWIGDEAIRPAVAALEAQANHPIARALEAALRDEVAELPGVDEFEHAIGAGVAGRVGGQRVAVGSRKFIEQNAAPLTPEHETQLAELTAAGLSPVLIARENEIIALAGLGDPIRPEAAPLINNLSNAGWQVGVLSGDHPDVVESVADQLDIPADLRYGGRTPEQKLAIVRESQTSRAVVMVGDGVNDAAALSAATVGVAVHGGAEVSLAAADVYLNRPGLGPIAELLGASRATFRTIRVGLIVSLVYNVVGASLAATGVINALIAAILMPISSFTVLAIVLGARTYR